MGVCASSISSKIRVHPSREKPDQKKVIEIWPGSEGWHLRSFMDGSSRGMVHGDLFKVDILLGGIPSGTFSFQDPHRVIIEDAGMDFLNHPRFKCAQNVQVGTVHVPKCVVKEVYALF